MNEYKSQNECNTYTKSLGNLSPKEEHLAKVYVMKNRIVVKVSENQNHIIGQIKKIGKYQSMNRVTGEIYDYTPDENSADVKRKRMNKSFERLGFIIDNNFSGGDDEIHIVLTCADASKTLDEINEEFKKFRKDMKYHYPHTEYIVIREMNGSSQWHLHVLVKNGNGEKLFIPQDSLEKWWPLGYVHVNRIRNNNSIAAYFTVFRKELDSFEKEEVVSEKVKLKRSRLENFPPYKRLYSKSKGIIPIEEKTNLVKNLNELFCDRVPYYKSATGILTEVDGSEILLNVVYTIEYRGNFSKEFLESFNGVVSN